jgi:uncharacterized protein (DUF58 family)
MRRLLQTFRQSVSIYAVSAVYAFGVLAMTLISTGDLMLIFGIIALGLVTVLIALIALHRETRRVHVLVNGQHTALIERVNQLIATLQESGVGVPRAYPKKGSHNG